MRKKRSLLRINWSDLRARINKTIAEKAFLETDFRPLSGPETWKQIEKKIYEKFCVLTHPTQRPLWLWTAFKLDTFSLSDLRKRPAFYLDQLVDETETVW